MQLLGRALHKLPTSALELFTLAIVICTLVSYASWWNKPLDVTKGLVIEMSDDEIPALYVSGTDRADPNPGLQVQVYWLRTSSYTAFILATSLVFGAVHLIAWNWTFPTPLERILWRTSSITCTVTPTIYLISRSYMLVEIFIGLRSMPRGVYTGVNWSNYLPHI